VIDAYEKYGATVIGLSEVKPEEVSQFGVMGGVDLGDDVYEVKQFIEKPKMSEAPSNLVQVGINVITPEIISILKNMKQGKSGEIRLADAYDEMLNQGRPLYGKKITGEWLDTGNKFNFIKATLKLGLKNEEVKDKLQALINELSQK
jgi:UTP--glucose-1-phosphate uridylyltransferase